MIPALAAFILLYGALLTAWALVRAVLRRAPGPGLVGGVVLLEVTLVVQAFLAAVRLAGGAAPPDPAVHAGYLVASVVLLPLVAAVTRVPGRTGGWTDTAVLAVACAGVVVVDARLIATAGPP